MAFEFYQDDMNTSPQLTYVKATEDEAYTPGELLKIGSAGTATKASGTDMPLYVCHQINGNAAALGKYDIHCHMYCSSLVKCAR